MKKLTEVNPSDLSGPRSFFTDIDPKDENYNEVDSIRKLKLQLLTKEKVVVPASSMFENIWLKIFKQNKDLIKLLENGILLPAIRDQFSGVKEFFQDKKYGKENEVFFLEHVTHYVPWNLKDNTTWYYNKFTKGLNDPMSVLRTKGNISEEQANEILHQLNLLIQNEDAKSRFLQRKHIEEVGRKYNSETLSFLTNYSNLIYRLSGSIVVKSEGHFPQSNLTKLKIVGNENLLSDENLFWDIYAETVFSFLGSAIRLTPNRLDNLTFKDISNIRKSFFDIGFSQDYDKLVNNVKNKTTLADPDKLILHLHEISGMAKDLESEFKARVQSEFYTRDTATTENALWQMANVVSLLSSPGIGLMVGALSALKSIPEITAPISKSLSESLTDRMSWLRRFVNNRIGWSDSQRKSFLDAYNELSIYGLK